MRGKCFCIDGRRRTTLAILKRSWPCIASFEMTWKLKKKKTGTLGPPSWCIHALLAPSPRGVVCKWVPGSALSVWQHSACEGPTDARGQAVRPSLARHPWGLATKTFVEGQPLPINMFTKVRPALFSHTYMPMTSLHQAFVFIVSFFTALPPSSFVMFSWVSFWFFWDFIMLMRTCL